MDRVSFGKGPPIQFGLGGRGSRSRAPVRGFDFGGGLERERSMDQARGPPRDPGGGPSGGGPGPAAAWQGGAPPASMQQQQPPRPSKLLGKMSGLRQAVAAQASEKQEAAAKEEEKQKRKDRKALEKATAALAAAEASEDPSELRAAAKLAEPFSEHRSGVRAARKRYRRLEAVEELMLKAQKAADQSHKQGIEALGGTIKALNEALEACGEFKRLGNKEELRSQLALAESRRTILEEQAEREKSAAKGLQKVAESEDVDRLNAAVTAAVVFDSLSKQTAAVQSRIKRLEQAQRAVELCDPPLLEPLRPYERIERLNAALAVVGDFRSFRDQKPKLREQLAAAEKLHDPKDDPRRQQAPPPLPAETEIGKTLAAAAAAGPKTPTVQVGSDAAGASPGPSTQHAAATAPAAAAAATAGPKAPTPSPRTIPHSNVIKPQPKTASIRIHKEQMSLALPMLGGDYAAHRSAKDSTALSRKRKDVLLGRQVHLFRVDGYYTSGQEQDCKLCDPRPSREYMGRHLADKEYRSVGFAHSKEVSNIRHRTVFVDKLVAPTDPDHVAECFALLGRVHEARVWTVPPLMDQPSRCFAMVNITTTAAAVTAFANDVQASIGSQGAQTATDEEKAAEALKDSVRGGADAPMDAAADAGAAGGWTSSMVTTPTANAVRLGSMAIRAGSAVVVSEDSDHKLTESAQKELRDAQSLLSSIDASVLMSSSSSSLSVVTDGAGGEGEGGSDGASPKCLHSPASPASSPLSKLVAKETQIDTRVARFRLAIAANSHSAVFATPSYFTKDDSDNNNEPEELQKEKAPTAAAEVKPEPSNTKAQQLKANGRGKPHTTPTKRTAADAELTGEIDLATTKAGSDPDGQQQQQQLPAPVDPDELASPLKRTRSVKKLKKRVSALKTTIRSSGVSTSNLTKMLCDHFALRCQHRFEPVSATLEQGAWYVEFADRRERDQAFERVNGSIFPKTYTKLKLEKCDRIRIVEEECSEAEAAAAEAAAAAAEDNAEDKRMRLRQCILMALKRVAMKECWRLAIEKPCIQHLEEAMPRYVKEAKERQAAIKDRQEAEEKRNIEQREQQRARQAQQRTQELQARRQQREAEKQAQIDREEEERRAKAARKEARRARRMQLEIDGGNQPGSTASPSPSPAAGATQSWDDTAGDAASSLPSVAEDDEAREQQEDEDEEQDDDAASLRASLELAAQLQAEEGGRGRRKRARPEAFVAEPSKQMKVDPSPRERARMLGEDGEEVAEDVPQYAEGDDDEQDEEEEDEDDMVALSSDDEDLGVRMKQPKAKKAKREKKPPKVLTEREEAIEVEQAMEVAVEEDEEIDEDEYFMRKFLLEQVSLSLPSTTSSSSGGGGDSTTSGSAAAATAEDGSSLGGPDTAGVVPPLERTASGGSADLGSPLPPSVKASVDRSKTPPKPKLKNPRKRRAKNLEAKSGPSTTARMVPKESYKEHVRGNVIMRAKAYVLV
jgi:hypothetical protein